MWNLLFPVQTSAYKPRNCYRRPCSCQQTMHESFHTLYNIVTIPRNVCYTMRAFLIKIFVTQQDICHVLLLKTLGVQPTKAAPSKVEPYSSHSMRRILNVVSAVVCSLMYNKNFSGYDMSFKKRAAFAMRMLLEMEHNCLMRMESIRRARDACILHYMSCRKVNSYAEVSSVCTKYFGARWMEGKNPPERRTHFPCKWAKRKAHPLLHVKCVHFVELDTNWEQKGKLLRVWHCDNARNLVIVKFQWHRQ